jgi:hypothetical protein
MAAVLVCLIADGRRMIARVDARTAARSGSEFKAALDIDKVHLFDPATEEALLEHSPAAEPLS